MTLMCFSIFLMDRMQLREEIEQLRCMQKELESQLAKERYRIKHLIRAVGELVAQTAS